jgi:hypothetical protein
MAQKRGGDLPGGDENLPEVQGLSLDRLPQKGGQDDIQDFSVERVEQVYKCGLTASPKLCIFR